MSGFAKALARIKAMLTRWDRGSFYAVPVHASRQRKRSVALGRTNNPVGGGALMTPDILIIGAVVGFFLIFGAFGWAFMAGAARLRDREQRDRGEGE